VNRNLIFDIGSSGCGAATDAPMPRSAHLRVVRGSITLQSRTLGLNTVGMLSDSDVPRDFSAALPEVRRRLAAWAGFEVVQHVLAEHDDLEIFLAGGVIRNLFIDPTRPVKDFDFFLRGASLDKAITVFAQHGRMHETPFGAPRWFPAAEPGRYADLIPIDRFIPGLWKCEDIVDVLNQFDFTASALAFDLRTGTAFNPQNGVRDAVRRTMRMVRFDWPEAPFIPGAPITRNAVLWFRVLHYAKQLGLTIEPLTLAWLRRNRGYSTQSDVFAELFFRPEKGFLAPL
jgi:hypothetical protein